MLQGELGLQGKADMLLIETEIFDKKLTKT